MAVNYDVYMADPTERLGVQFTVPAVDVRAKPGYFIDGETLGLQDDSIVYAATSVADAYLFNHQYLGNSTEGFEEAFAPTLKNLRLCVQLETALSPQPRYMAGYIEGAAASFLNATAWDQFRYVTKWDACTNCLLVIVHIMNRQNRSITCVYYDTFLEDYGSLHDTGYDETSVVIGFSFSCYSSTARNTLRRKNELNIVPMVEYVTDRVTAHKLVVYGCPYYSCYADQDLENQILTRLIKPMIYRSTPDTLPLTNPRFIEHWYGGQYSAIENDWVGSLSASYTESQTTTLATTICTQNYYPPESWIETGFYANARQYVVNDGGTCYLYPVFSLGRIQKAVSALGLYWTGNIESAQNSALGFGCTDEKIHLGVMTEQGYTDGSFVSGIACATAWQNSVDDIIGKRVITPVDPEDPPSPTPPPYDEGEDDTRKRNDGTNLPQVSGIRLVSGTGFSTFYLLSSYHVAELGTLLSQMPDTFWQALGTATDYKMSNILDYVSALKWYPVNLAASAPSLYPDVQTNSIQFGFNGVSKVTLSSPGTSYRLGTVNRVFYMGSIYIPYRASSQTFLDQEPYTDVYANLPYIGKAQLQANQVLGYSIQCYYILDLITGMATCFLDNGYDTIYTGSSKIGVDISVSGNDILTQSERMSSAYVGTVTHAISNSLALGGSLAAQTPVGAIAGTSSLISGLVADSIETANAKRGIPQVVGGGSGFGSTYASQTPAIIVQRPAVKIPQGYGHSIGYIYNTYASIGSLSGFTVCDNPDLSGIPATSSELQMIKEILSTGFYA